MKKAFPYSDLKKEIYIYIPKGFMKLEKRVVYID